MVNWQNAGRIASKGFNLVSNTIGVPLDYMAGKAQGEDDFRAGAGAVASGLGGWKGALAGAGLGSTLGPAGTLIGGIAGGMAGDFAGGWAADRLDETVRGKRALANTNTGVNKSNMAQNVQLENGDVAQVDDNGNIVGWLIKGGAVVAGGEALYGAGRNAYQEIARQRQASNIGLGMNRPFNLTNTIDDARAIGSQALEGAANSRAGQSIGAMPVWGKVAAGALLADQTFNGGRITNTLLRPFTGGADMIANAAGFKTDFDGQNKVSQEAMKKDREQQRIEQNRGVRNPYDDEMYNRYRMMVDDVSNREQSMWQRNKDEAWKVADKADEVSRRNYLTNFTANQANALLQGYITGIPQSVNDSLKTVFSARYN